MFHCISSDPNDESLAARHISERLDKPTSSESWQTFDEILVQLHREGVYLHPDQLAEFLILHGLPVDLRYVPERLHHKAAQINDNYQGDMARLETVVQPPWYSYLFE